jgi:hypothetical protein
MVCAKCTISLEIILDAPDGILGCEAQVEAHFSPFGDGANLDARWVHGSGQTYHGLKNHFGCNRCNSLPPFQDSVSVHER